MKKVLSLTMRLTLLLHLCFIGVMACGQEPVDSLAKKLDFPDGPYLLYERGGVNAVVVDEKGAISQTFYPEGSFGGKFPVQSHFRNYQFEVGIHDTQRPPWKYAQPDKVFVLSDPHANMECFVSILQAGKVINDRFEWTFGKNHLVVIGDVFDRGNDALPIFWLIYKLEKEAADAGGCVSFLLGNHEEMVLRGDLRYAEKKYTDLAESLGVPYEALWRENSELGRWLGSRNTMMIIGSDLYVHAGLSRAMLNAELDIPQVNAELSRRLFLSKPERSQTDMGSLLFGNSGPLWYRGLVRDDESYNPISEEELDLILEKFQAKRILVGHTIFDDISQKHQGKVITVNVDNKKNMKAGKGRGVLIEKGAIYAIYDSGAVGQIE